MSTASVALKKTRLTDRQRELVALMRVDDNRAVYTGGEHIADWAALKNVMVALGGKWTTGRKGAPGGFVFADDVDAHELVRLAGDTGEILDPNAYDFYPTPDKLARVLVEKLDLRPMDRVLEPSAGTGALVIAVGRKLAVDAPRVECYEVLPEKINTLLYITTTNVARRDFLTIDPKYIAPFDAVAMNPPFSKRADIAHVTHALQFLRPGGRLAAIMSAGVLFRQDKLAKGFRDLVAANAGTMEENPPRSFHDSGTDVSTIMVMMTKG